MADSKGASGQQIVIAANNGDIGGGEVMLFNIALMLKKLGREVVVLAPSQPGQVAQRANELGLDTLVLEADSRITWLLSLRKWRKRNRSSLLWCNGLLPAFATSFQRNRLVHLHQRPAGLLKLAAFLARLNRPLTLVPSNSMASAVSGSKVLFNWVDVPPISKRHEFDGATLKVGFIGRLSVDKGITTLCDAIRHLKQAEQNLKFELVIAGEPRFTSATVEAAVNAALGSISGSVTTLGWVKPVELLEQIDVLAVPSNAYESFGLVVAEAMAAEVPFICSSAGALPEVSGLEYALTFAAGDSDALASILAKVAKDLAEHSKTLQNTIRFAKERWLSHFSPMAAERNLANLLRDHNL